MAFHTYGLFIGIAIVVALQLFEFQARRFAPRLLSHPRFWWLIAGTVLGGVIGARAWHVATDWQLYVDQPLDALRIWQGGLSIIGAVAGGLLACGALLRLLKIRAPFTLMADIVVFGLPVAQAIGRLGNYFNQELYGLPAERLPWSITIDAQHRLAQYAQFTRFHPIFAYEAIALLTMAWWFWQHARRAPQRVGTGFFVTWYFLAYAWVRFWLDFLRPEKSLFMGSHWGVNQVVLVCVVVACAAIVVRRAWVRPAYQLIGGLVLASAVVVCLIAASSGQAIAQSARFAPQAAVVSKIADRQIVGLQLGQRELRVEAVTTPRSWTQGLSGRSEIGSDGMLFIFPQKELRRFWMIDMQFDLDMVWLADGAVIGVTANVPKPLPGQVPAELPTFASPGAADWVLELPAGKAGEYGIEPGTNGMIKPVSP